MDCSEHRSVLLPLQISTGCTEQACTAPVPHPAPLRVQSSFITCRWCKAPTNKTSWTLWKARRHTETIFATCLQHQVFRRARPCQSAAQPDFGSLLEPTDGGAEPPASFRGTSFERVITRQFQIWDALHNALKIKADEYTTGMQTGLY